MLQVGKRLAMIADKRAAKCHAASGTGARVRRQPARARSSRPNSPVAPRRTTLMTAIAPHRAQAAKCAALKTKKE